MLLWIIAVNPSAMVAEQLKLQKKQVVQLENNQKSSLQNLATKDRELQCAMGKLESRYTSPCLRMADVFA